MEGRHSLPNANSFSSPTVLLFFFFFLFALRNLLFAERKDSFNYCVCIISKPPPLTNSCSFWGISKKLHFLSSFSSEYRDVSLATLGIKLPSFAPGAALIPSTVIHSNHWGGFHSCCRHSLTRLWVSLCSQTSKDTTQAVGWVQLELSVRGSSSHWSQGHGHPRQDVHLGTHRLTQGKQHWSNLGSSRSCKKLQIWGKGAGHGRGPLKFCSSTELVLSHEQKWTRFGPQYQVSFVSSWAFWEKVGKYFHGSDNFLT